MQLRFTAALNRIVLWSVRTREGDCHSHSICQFPPEDHRQRTEQNSAWAFAGRCPSKIGHSRTPAVPRITILFKRFRRRGSSPSTSASELDLDALAKGALMVSFSASRCSAAYVRSNWTGTPPPCRSPPLVVPQGGVGDRHLVNPKFFVAAHCVVVWVTMLWGTATCIPCTHGGTFCLLSLKWNLTAQPCFPLGPDKCDG